MRSRYVIVFIFLFSIFTASISAQSAAQVPAPVVAPLVSVPANAALAAKAPGAPGFGLQVRSSTGVFLLTNLYVDPSDKKIRGPLYRVVGPAGLGPYRIGAEFDVVSYQATAEVPHPPIYFRVLKTDWGFPADKAGLREGDLLSSVDGSNFGWDLNALAWHISNSPVITVAAVRVFKKTPRITTSKLDTPVDPGDGNLEAVKFEGVDAEVMSWGRDYRTWKDLLILRSKTDKFAPFAFELAGRKLWVVRVQLDPSLQKDPSRPSFVLEFWKEDPLTGPINTGILDVWQVPADSHQSGRVLKIEDRWYRVQDFHLDPASGRILSFDLYPWETDIDSLLSGVTLDKALGPQKTPLFQESLEHTANDALVEWKTRTLPGLLKTQDAAALEDMVVRTEKGLLDLDLAIRGMRQRLDDLARAKAAQQAQASMPGGNQTAPAPAAPTADSEALADLLDQRKAILQAILGSTKQALALVRR